MKKIKCQCGCGQIVNPGKCFILGHNNRGKHHTKEARQKISLAKQGEKNPMFGVHLLSSFYGKHHSKESKKKLSEAKKLYYKKHPGVGAGKNNGFYGKSHLEKTKEKMCRLGKKRWQNLEYRENVLAGIDLKPNKPERRLRNGLNKMFPGEYKFVGDGKIWIVGKNPDFININGQKKIIEMFGDYWHSKEISGRTKKQEENQRINHFAKYGFRTLIIWQRELKDIPKLKKKLVKFHRTK